MKKPILTLMCFVTAVALWAANNDFYISGRIKDAMTKIDLLKAWVLTYDNEGNVKDSIRSNMGLKYVGGQLDTTSYFFMKVPRVDSTYVFDVVCEGYKPITTSFSVSKIGKRESGRDMGIIYMERAPIMLKDVTVTSSKIKFYNNGDTLVYNADAFQLAEGSMLDALIAQLPGVELNSNGQIKVNGEFVESLLLDGKPFFDGNNNLMLENIAAYTVKNIKVYEAPTPKNTVLGNTSEKVLTMNVQLKKEYNIGWLINAQGGYGTDNRYLGKLLASWFNPTTRISFVGNMNNLNSNKTPGRNDTWTPDEMPDGTKTYAIAGASYSYEHPERKSYAEGNVFFRQSIDNVRQTTNTINFLPSADTYEYAYSRNHNRSTAVSMSHFFNFKTSKSIYAGVDLNGSYMYSKQNASSLAGSFADDPGEMTAQILDAIYSNGSPELLDNILNRSKTRTDDWSRNYWINVSPYISYHIPKTRDNLIFTFDFDYLASKGEVRRDYEINYGANGALNPQMLSQFNNKSPDHTLNLGGVLQYRSYGEHYNINARYKYKFSDKVVDSYMYTLDRLNEMGVYGVLPENSSLIYSFDAQNSFLSRTFTNTHSINPNFSYFTNIKTNRLQINIMPEVALVHRKFSYWNNFTDYRLSKTNATVTVSGYAQGMLQFDFNRKGEGRDIRYRNSLRYSYSVTPTLPELSDMIDIVNTANPLNIYLGNPDLKMAWRHRHLFRWQYLPHSHTTFNNTLYLSYTHANNSLTRGFTYDTTTGVRYNKMYNVDGNHTWALTNELNWQFGATKQFTLSSTTDGILATYNDMIGTQGQEPAKTTVQTNTLTENVRLAWRLGKQTLSLRCDFTARHTTSQQPDFNTINATHVNYGVTGNFILPAGFGISTDFLCYTRRGYGSPNLDTTDPVWNARISYAPSRLKHWVFMLDGFDILHSLSNVNYAVSASGRTVSYTNVIPRYVMLSVQYRLNIQPKKM